MPLCCAPPLPAGAAPRRAAGFTLVEVLVALLILAVMAAMSWQGLDTLMRTREVAQARMEGLLRAQSVMAQWETDLQQVVSTQVAPGLSFDGGTLHLTRRHPDGVQVVAWSLRGGSLTRWTAAPTTRSEALQDAWLQSFQLLGNEAAQLTTLQGVSQWQVYFFRNNAWTNAQSSGDVATAEPQDDPPITPAPPAGGASAPPTQRQQRAAPKEALPQGVRVVVTFAEQGTLPGTITRDVRISP